MPNNYQTNNRVHSDNYVSLGSVLVLKLLWCLPLLNPSEHRVKACDKLATHFREHTGCGAP